MKSTKEYITDLLKEKAIIDRRILEDEIEAKFLIIRETILNLIVSKYFHD